MGGKTTERKRPFWRGSISEVGRWVVILFYFSICFRFRSLCTTEIVCRAGKGHWRGALRTENEGLKEVKGRRGRVFFLDQIGPWNSGRREKLKNQVHCFQTIHFLRKLVSACPIPIRVVKEGGKQQISSIETNGCAVSPNSTVLICLSFGFPFLSFCEGSLLNVILMIGNLNGQVVGWGLCPKDFWRKIRLLTLFIRELSSIVFTSSMTPEINGHTFLTRVTHSQWQWTIGIIGNSHHPFAVLSKGKSILLPNLWQTRWGMIMNHDAMTDFLSKLCSEHD